jgi:hypothetical protein
MAKKVKLKGADGAVFGDKKPGVEMAGIEYPLLLWALTRAWYIVPVVRPSNIVEEESAPGIVVERYSVGNTPS